MEEDHDLSYEQMGSVLFNSYINFFSVNISLFILRIVPTERKKEFLNKVLKDIKNNIESLVDHELNELLKNKKKN